MHKHLRTYIITLFVLLAGVVSAGLISRLTTFTDGSVLFASDLNGEFNQLVNLVNGNLDNDNISASAAISPAKITAAIAGDGISRNGSTGALAVNVDDSTIEIDADTVQVKDDGITFAKTAEIAGLSVLGTATASTGNVAAITAGTDAYALLRSGSTLTFGQIQTGGVADAAITQVKRAAATAAISSSSGSYSATSATLTDVTNLSATITSVGRPVLIGMVSADTSDLSGTPNAVNGMVSCNRSSGTPCDGQLAIRESSTVLAEFSVSGTSAADIGHPCSGFSHFILAPSAGSHQYKISVRRSSANTTISVTSCKMYVVEL